MKPSNVAKAVRVSLEAQQPVFMWGPPGVGKSSVVNQVSESMGLEMIDLRALLLDPVDVRGLPHVNGDNRAHWCPPEFFPHDPDSRGVLFLDELNAAAQMVQASLYQLILDRRVGEYRLPDGWSVIAAGNRQKDRAVVHKMPSALQNRFVHIDFNVDINDWCEWAQKNNIVPEVLSFIRYRPDALYDFDPESADNAFPTPRTWEFVSNLMKRGMPEEVEFEIIRGTVGEGATGEFEHYLDIYRSLQSVDSILGDPKRAEIPEDTAEVYALCGAVSARANETNIDRVKTFIDRLPAEYNIMTMKEMRARCPEIGETEEYTAWAAENMHVLT